MPSIQSKKEREPRITPCGCRHPKRITSKMHQVTLSLGAVSSIVLACTVAVPVVGSSITEAALTRALQLGVSEQLDCAPDDVLVTWVGDPMGNAPVLRNAASYRLSDRFSLRHLGQAVVPMAFVCPGGRVSEANLLAHIAVKKRVVRSTRTLTRHEVLSPQCLEESEVVITAWPPDRLPPLTDVLGKRTRRILRQGELITRHMIETIPDIARGTRLTLELRGGGVRIETEGVALENGYLGERMKVRVIGGSKRLTGVLAQPFHVLVTL